MGLATYYDQLVLYRGDNRPVLYGQELRRSYGKAWLYEAVVMTTNVLYRYEIGYRNYDDGETRLFLRELKVLEETDKTYLVQNYHQKKRIRKSSFNAYAHAQKDKALAHFKRRTTKRVSWYEFWVEECNKALELTKQIESNFDLTEVQYDDED